MRYALVLITLAAMPAAADTVAHAGFVLGTTLAEVSCSQDPERRNAALESAMDASFALGLESESLEGVAFDAPELSPTRLTQRIIGMIPDLTQDAAALGSTARLIELGFVVKRIECLPPGARERLRAERRVAYIYEDLGLQLRCNRWDRTATRSRIDELYSECTPSPRHWGFDLKRQPPRADLPRFAGSFQSNLGSVELEQRGLVVEGRLFVRGEGVRQLQGRITADGLALESLTGYGTLETGLGGAHGRWTSTRTRASEPWMLVRSPDTPAVPHSR